MNEDSNRIYDILQTIQTLKSTITTNITTVKDYARDINPMKYTIKTSGNLEDRIEDLQRKLNIFFTIPMKRKRVREEFHQIISYCDEIKENIMKLTSILDNETEKIIQQNNNLAENLQMLKKEQFEIEKRKLEEKYSLEFSDIEKKMLNEQELVMKMKSRQSVLNENILTEDEISTIENWTIRQCGNVLFDSNVDDWKMNTSVFSKKIMESTGKLLFVINDEKNNKFGAYITQAINKIDEWIDDENAFVFSLKSNGRLEKPMMFEIQDENWHGAMVYNDNDDMLIHLGSCGQISLKKEEKKEDSYCNQNLSFDYQVNGVIDKHTLCGEFHFVPKRIVVIQML